MDNNNEISLGSLASNHLIQSGLPSSFESSSSTAGGGGGGEGISKDSFVIPSLESKSSAGGGGGSSSSHINITANQFTIPSLDSFSTTPRNIPSLTSLESTIINDANFTIPTLDFGSSTTESSSMDLGNNDIPDLENLNLNECSSSSSHIDLMSAFKVQSVQNASAALTNSIRNFSNGRAVNCDEKESTKIDIDFSFLLLGPIPSSSLINPKCSRIGKVITRIYDTNRTKREKLKRIKIGPKPIKTRVKYFDFTLPSPDDVILKAQSKVFKRNIPPISTTSQDDDIQ